MKMSISKYPAALFTLSFIVILMSYSPRASYYVNQAVTASPTPIVGKMLKSLEQIQQLMVADADCQLPCFWQFRPGKTMQNEVMRFLGLDSSNDFKGESLEYDYYKPNTAPPNEPVLSIGFGLDDDNLRLITIDLAKPNEWLPATNTLELSSLLQKMDTTPEIYLAINVTTRRFFLVIVSESKGVMLQYTFDFEDDQFFPFSSQPIQLCLRQKQDTDIMLWLQSSDDKRPIEDEIYLAMPSGFLKHDTFYKPIQFVTGLDAKTFIERIITDPDGCIQALSFDELSKQGQEFP